MRKAIAFPLPCTAVPQRLSSRELYRQMKHLPPEYPTGE